MERLAGRLPKLCVLSKKVLVRLDEAKCLPVFYLKGVLKRSLLNHLLGAGRGSHPEGVGLIFLADEIYIA